MAIGGVEIRKAIPADSLALAEIQVASYRQAYAGLLPEDYLEQFTVSDQEKDWAEWIDESSVDELLVAIENSRTPVGYALLDLSSPGFKDFEAELLALHVLASHRNQGVGRKLFAGAARSAKANGAGSLYLWVLEGNPAQAFYQQLGGELIGKQPWGGNEHYQTSVLELAYGWSSLDQLLMEVSR